MIIPVHHDGVTRKFKYSLRREGEDLFVDIMPLDTEMLGKYGKMSMQVEPHLDYQYYNLDDIDIKTKVYDFLCDNQLIKTTQDCGC